MSADKLRRHHREPELHVRRGREGLRVSGLLFAVLVGSSACRKDDPRPPESTPGLAGSPTMAVCPSPQQLTYASFGQDFMQRYCLACHSSALPAGTRSGAPLGANFDTAEKVRGFIEGIDEYAASGPEAMNDGMPLRGAKPTEAERIRLGLWLACGAP